MTQVPLASTGSRRRVLPHLLRRGSLLLHQQCWLWGCDIRRSGGNLLLQHGFLRQPDPAQTRSTQYTRALEDGSVVRLWGSGFYFGSGTEGIYLNRFLFEPRLVRVTDDWQDPAELKRAPRFVDLRLLSRACMWMASYEDWVSAHAGTAYRRVCVSSGPCPRADVCLLAALWRALALELDGLRAA